jgi:hypothetical protein
MNAARAMRRAAGLVGAGLAVQLGASFNWTPGTFVLAAVVGIPLVLAGTVQFAVVVLGILRRKGAL